LAFLLDKKTLKTPEIYKTPTKPMILHF